MPVFNGFLPQKGLLEFSGAFFVVEIFEKVSFDPYNFRITRLSARKSKQMKNFCGIKISLYLRLNTKIRSTMQCLSGFELYSRWVSLIGQLSRDVIGRLSVKPRCLVIETHQ